MAKNATGVGKTNSYLSNSLDTVQQKPPFYMINKSLYTPKFSFGKWCFLFIGGIILFLIAYSLATIPELYIVNNWISGTLSLISGLLLLLMYRWLVGSYEDRKIDELSMRKCLRHTGIGLLWGVLMMSATIGIFALCGWYKIVGFSFNAAVIYRLLMTYFVVAVGEEIVFRGIMFRLLDSQFNVWVALLISAVVFGVAHIINPNATLISTIGISLAAGVLFGLLFKYYRTLWVPIGIHWSWNFVQGTVTGSPVSGMAPDYSILKSVTSGPEILTGGPFGPEASIILMILGLVLCIWVGAKLIVRK